MFMFLLYPFKIALDLEKSRKNGSGFYIKFQNFLNLLKFVKKTVKRLQNGKIWSNLKFRRFKKLLKSVQAYNI